MTSPKGFIQNNKITLKANITYLVIIICQEHTQPCEALNNYISSLLYTFDKNTEFTFICVFLCVCGRHFTTIFTEYCRFFIIECLYEDPYCSFLPAPVLLRKQVLEIFAGQSRLYPQAQKHNKDPISTSEQIYSKPYCPRPRMWCVWQSLPYNPPTLPALPTSALTLDPRLQQLEEASIWKGPPPGNQDTGQ